MWPACWAKGAKPGEPVEVQFDSPWGKGRPGWHIECSAMSQALLGDTLDIHGGGLDLQFPHHENELAQSESDTGKPFARVWMHNGLLRLGASKMAGSVGNVLNVADAFARGVTGDVLRFFILNTHYRSPIDLGEWDAAEGTIPPGIGQAQRAYDTFARFAERVHRITGTHLSDLPKPTRIDGPRATLSVQFGGYFGRFIEHMNDDFNTGGAVGVLFELLPALNRFADEAKLEIPAASAADKTIFATAAGAFRELTALLGLALAPLPTAASHDSLTPKLLDLLVELRNDARKAKNFALSDAIRDKLKALNITFEDSAQGTRWKIG